ncbi:MAG: hypothetical protein V4525_09380 [Pseudomonadota bacterium]
MSLQKRLLFIAIASALTTTVFAQSEPYYIPNTTPARANQNYDSPSAAPSYAAPLEVSNTGRPAANDINSDRSSSASSMADMPPINSYAQIGSQGVGIGIGLKVNPSWVVRAEINGLNYNRDFTKAGNSYTGKAKLRTEGVYGDYYPIADSGMRVTGGLVFNQTKLTGIAKPNSANQIALNGNNYLLAAGETLSAEVKSPSVLPYLGLGYEHNPNNTKTGLKFMADFGLAFGKKPEAKIQLPTSLSANNAAITDRQTEETKLEDSFSKFSPWVGKVQPMANIGIGYTW